MPESTTAMIDPDAAAPTDQGLIEDISTKVVEIDKRSQNLAGLAHDFESRDQRERSMLLIMHNLAERSKANENRWPACSTCWRTWSTGRCLLRRRATATAAAGD